MESVMAMLTHSALHVQQSSPRTLPTPFHPCLPQQYKWHEESREAIEEAFDTLLQVRRGCRQQLYCGSSRDSCSISAAAAGQPQGHRGQQLQQKHRHMSKQHSSSSTAAAAAAPMIVVLACWQAVATEKTTASITMVSSMSSSDSKPGQVIWTWMSTGG
jgi:hypothetical protein